MTSSCQRSLVSRYWEPSGIEVRYKKCVCVGPCVWINTLRPRQNGRHFADDLFKCIFLNETAWISLEISLKFVPKVQINNIPATRHYLNQWWLVYWRIYASLGLNELTLEIKHDAPTELLNHILRYWRLCVGDWTLDELYCIRNTSSLVIMFYSMANAVSLQRGQFSSKCSQHKSYIHMSHSSHVRASYGVLFVV